MVKSFVNLVRSVPSFFRGENKGASMVEYALLVGLIAVVSITVVTTLGTSVRSMFTQVSGAL